MKREIWKEAHFFKSWSHLKYSQKMSFLPILSSHISDEREFCPLRSGGIKQNKKNSVTVHFLTYVNTPPFLKHIIWPWLLPERSHQGGTQRAKIALHVT